ncbi:MAG: heavy metal translocating P-type ATPase, partial [Actinomycetes bacterium]
MKLGKNKLLLLVASLSLFIGAIFLVFDASIISECFWAFGGIAGLIPAVTWVFVSMKNREYGADILAVFSLIGTLLTKNFLAASIISLMLATGRTLEDWAEKRAERELTALMSRVPQIAHLLDSNGKISDLEIALVEVGQRILVKSGEVVPTDGVLESAAELDQSALTGEPLPVLKQRGDPVQSGVLNTGNNVEMVATSTAEASTYAAIIRLVKQAQSHSSSSIRLANTWSARFLPIAVLMGVLTLILSHSVARMVAVFVTATPCPLILAVPVAVVSGISRAAKNGVLVKSGSVLEQLTKIRVVLLDKTGTLTRGGPEVSQVSWAPESSEREVLRIAASLDQFSPHVVARAITLEAARQEIDLVAAVSIEETHGHGISGKIDGRAIFVGQIELVPPWLIQSHALMVGVYQDEVLLGVIGLEDPIRSESITLLDSLKSLGVAKVYLVTGDRLESAQTVADQVGITEIFASVTAEEKLRIVDSAQIEFPGGVLFVGDGINDAPALTKADVGIAMGSRGISAASEAADAVIVVDSLGKLVTAIEIAKTSVNRALQAATIGM